MSAPQDPTHPKAFEGDDVEGHMPFKYGSTGADASVAEETSDVEGHLRFRNIPEDDANVEQSDAVDQSDDDVEGHGIKTRG